MAAQPGGTGPSDDAWHGHGRGPNGLRHRLVHADGHAGYDRPDQLASQVGVRGPWEDQEHGLPRERRERHSLVASRSRQAHQLAEGAPAQTSCAPCTRRRGVPSSCSQTPQAACAASPDLNARVPDQAQTASRRLSLPHVGALQFLCSDSSQLAALSALITDASGVLHAADVKVVNASAFETDSVASVLPPEVPGARRWLLLARYQWRRVLARLPRHADRRHRVLPRPFQNPTNPDVTWEAFRGDTVRVVMSKAQRSNKGLTHP
mmetsp:Transcript_73406/g.203837  ORF Transcript_73406/g.203837 Transcript_73406/m.203837 type:complete len:264 (+) Transcript_73406:147-938(+)